MTDEEIETIVDEFIAEEMGKELKEAIKELVSDDGGNIEPPEIKPERTPEPPLIRWVDFKFFSSVGSIKKAYWSKRKRQGEKAKPYLARGYQYAILRSRTKKK